MFSDATDNNLHPQGLQHAGKTGFTHFMRPWIHHQYNIVYATAKIPKMTNDLFLELPNIGILLIQGIAKFPQNCSKKSPGLFFHKIRRTEKFHKPKDLKKTDVSEKLWGKKIVFTMRLGNNLKQKNYLQLKNALAANNSVCASQQQCIIRLNNATKALLNGHQSRESQGIHEAAKSR